MAEADWSSLPSELVQQIANRLSSIEDFVRFSSVSRDFRSSLEKDQWRPVSESSRSPWLLLGGVIYKTSSYIVKESSALSMYTKKIFPMNLPELHGYHFFGTTYGWILTLALDFQVYLFNPLSQGHIALPEPPFFIRRILLIKRPPSSSRCEDDFVVVASGGRGGELGVRRPGKTTWESVNFDIEPVRDMAYYKGQIYAVCGPHGRIVICSNLDGPGPLIKVDSVPGKVHVDNNFYGYFYLLESSGDLLWVAQWLGVTNDETQAFDVFKFNPQTKKLTVVKDLGDRSLFVGGSQSMSLSSPETYYCARNCIHYTDRKLLSTRSMSAGPWDMDMGVFDLKSRTIKRFFKRTLLMPLFFVATWFIPTWS